MKKWTLLIILSLTMFLVACSDDEAESDEQANQAENQEDQAQQQEPLEISDEEVVNEGESVVVVNGSEVNGTTYNAAYSLVKSMMHQSGQDTSDLDALKDQTVDFLVEQELMLQEANNVGIEVTDEELEEELKAYKESADEGQFNTMLEQLNMTEENFKNQLRYDLTTMEYVEQEFEVEVTDKEVEELYNQMTEQSEGEAQELSEVEDQLRASIEQQKQQQQYAQKVEELKESAEIDKKI
ncbi:MULTISPECIES: SurA N-terminal domain-containing protein [Oceanobacillus]|uniref:SurA N-terminal domain-containing protein n=1 Tax=Oceanobacillus TaxID=182709 RepID=UPI0003464F2E|nr:MULTISPECIES: SurA N-terminal domain-containing protein [Oceanobacillus]MBT2652864.1 SurA N-terminal domain-containing protein [Oceanobacillus sp. ISL-73]MCT1577408.1 SurA N-terminal domain-containing protein [Oceanobacillus kimchii]MCT2137014.1 SurA N-terminal domain-containing protein [Oceanobacillus kimchii]OEH53609.1 hypothetical protein AQ616_14045 [Oceanobacillus sp. E9]